ncbi:MAG TPA: glycosyltransferase family 25 protein, partial [Bacteroidia bacterium]|nr:glycosyltransferase family 25 protein [Bacteroidia bacterium]
DMEEVNKLRWWLTNGAIGCALSHYKAYEYIIENNLKYAFILEDDAVMPENTGQILQEIENKILDNEIILLYYASFSPCKLSTVGKVNLTKKESLVYPIDITQTITATAYIITNKAAKNMLDMIKPIRVAADSWYYYYDKGAFTSLRVLYPTAFNIKYYKSSIDYINTKSAKGMILHFINTYKIPLLFQLLRYRRGKRRGKMLNHFSLTNEESPIYKKLESEVN